MYRKQSISANSSLCDHETGIFSDAYFHEILNLEKRRAERSDKQFALMLLDIGRVHDVNNVTMLKRLSRVLRQSTRNTDIKGWYADNRVIGVIFTEIREIDRSFILEKIFRKLYKNLCRIFDLEFLSAIDISFQFFPEGKQGEKPVSPYRVKPLKELRAPLLSMAKPAQKQEKEQESDASLTKQIGKASLGWVLFAGDLSLVLLAAFLSAWLGFGDSAGSRQYYLEGVLFSSLIYPVSLYVFDLYNLGRAFRPREALPRTAFAMVLAGLASALLFFLLPHWQDGRWVLLIQIAVIWVLLVFWRGVYGISFQEATSKENTVIVGAGESGRAIQALLESPLSPYRVIGFLDDNPENQGKPLGSAAVLGPVDRLGDVARSSRVKVAILANPRDCEYCTPRLFRTILEARLQGLDILEMPTVYERLTGRVPVKHIEDQWLLYAEGFDLIAREYVQKIKRILDLFVSGTLLFCAAPMMLLTALAIRLDSPGPIFYRQERVGKGGKIFTVVKFRSMHQNAEVQGAKWATKGDPRVTRVGKWIRIFRIDELPQLWNVFRGDMSIVGPRPERPEFVRELEKKIPYYFVRHSAPPGVTGWAQINYPYGASVEDAQRKLEYDLYYVKNMSLVLDFKILLRTVGVVLMGEGAR